ncbi:hypothetical protein [Novosphingobium sp.]|uniref:hypothetical protein n=1 Tax=Novosphingobium sp. TaxID=1874826 RepID=UPI00286E279C|nr:hypothetical protein [Novosphingobium sp.]
MRKTAMLLTSALATLSGATFTGTPAFAQTTGAFAQEGSASAQGSVVIEQPVGSGIAYNVLTSALSSVFLSGRSGDAVSLTSAVRSGDAVVLSADTWPVSLGRAAGAPGPQGQANLLFLAQFN